MSVARSSVPVLRQQAGNRSCTNRRTWELLTTRVGRARHPIWWVGHVHSEIAVSYFRPSEVAVTNLTSPMPVCEPPRACGSGVRKPAQNCSRGPRKDRPSLYMALEICSFLIRARPHDKAECPVGANCRTKSVRKRRESCSKLLTRSRLASFLKSETFSRFGTVSDPRHVVFVTGITELHRSASRQSAGRRDSHNQSTAEISSHQV